MLEEQEEVAGPLPGLDAKQEVGLVASKLLIHEGTCLELETLEIEASKQLLPEKPLQQGCGPGGILENSPRQFVMFVASQERAPGRADLAGGEEESRDFGKLLAARLPGASLPALGHKKKGNLLPGWKESLLQGERQLDPRMWWF